MKINDVIQEIKQVRFNINCQLNGTGKFEEAFDRAIEILEDVQESDWILFKDEFPKEKEWIGTNKFGTTISDEVYVTFEMPGGTRFCDHLRLQNGKPSLSKQAEIDAFCKGAKLVAWKPIPKPYEGK